jgi:hypothetical protein
MIVQPRLKAAEINYSGQRYAFFRTYLRTKEADCPLSSKN